jgi:cobalt-zinc-cadmium efflux system protein
LVGVGLHDHPHDHWSPVPVLAGVLALTLGYMAAEIAGGVVSGSLALLADAGHMLTDAGALALSLLAAWFAARPPTPQKSFGYYRLEILAALINGASLIAIAGWIGYEALNRLAHPVPVDTPVMAAVAAGGLLVNLAGIWLLESRAHGSLNVRGAMVHVIGDALGSAGTLLASAIIALTDWYQVDSLVSLGIAVLVLRSAWLLIVQSADILMLGCPVHLDPDEVHRAIEAAAGVRSAHDLHIWTVSSRMLALSCHVVASEGSDPDAILSSLRRRLNSEYGIEHVTIQVEAESLERQERCVRAYRA